MVQIVLPLSGAALVTFVLAAATLLAPDVMARHVQEDASIEMATAFSFLLAAAFAAAGACRGRADAWVLAVGTGSFIAFLDEISFGQRLAGWEVYRIYGVEIDAAHDFLLVARLFLADNFESPYLVFGVGVLAILCCAATVIWKCKLYILFLQSTSVDLVLVATAAGLIGASQVMDLELALLHHPAIEASYIEEHLELAAGLLTLWFVTYRVLAPRLDRRHRVGEPGRSAASLQAETSGG